MNIDPVIRCYGEGCARFFQQFQEQHGSSDGGAFQLVSSTLQVETPWSWTDLLSVWVVGGVVGSIFLLILLASAFFIVRQQHVAVIERLGKYRRVAHPGLHMKIPLMERIVDEIELYVTPLEAKVETKTKDNVFVVLTVAVQYRAIQEKVVEACYKLTDEDEQLTSFVFDSVRSRVPKLTLDDVFEQKDEIAGLIKHDLNELMADYGWTIEHALIVDVTPDAKVMSAMNEINAAQRFRVAATEKGEAEKIITVKNAEAKKDSDILHGEGIAGQRKAMIVGLKDSVIDFQKAVPGASEQDVLQIVMMSQYFDMLKELPKDGNTRVLMLPHSPNALKDIGQQLKESLLVTNHV